jgi:hypothetical protein
MKKILLIASFGPSSPGATYLKSLRHKGYDPLCFDMREEYQKVFSHKKNPLINSVVKPYVARIMNNRLMSIVGKYKPDLVFIHKDLDLDPLIVDEIKKGSQRHLHMFDNDFKPVEEILLA